MEAPLSAEFFRTMPVRKRVSRSKGARVALRLVTKGDRHQISIRKLRRCWLNGHCSAPTANEGVDEPAAEKPQLAVEMGG